MTTAIVYVQLGDNPSKTLVPFATQSAKVNENAVHILLTDRPKKWPTFPGEIVDISNLALSSGFRKFEKDYKELKKVAGGYWINTLKRLFVLESLIHTDFKWTDIIHYESDVYPLVTEDVIGCLRSNISCAAVPRFSKDRGIASVLYIRDKSSLSNFTNGLSRILVDNPHNRDDMELLGAALNGGIIQELPSLPQDAWIWQGKNYIFDGAAYGQYLFGQDAFHTSGKVIPGFRNPSFLIDIKVGFWNLQSDNSTKKSRIIFNYLGKEYDIANIHVHSKVILPDPLTGASEWNEIIDVANGQVEPMITLSTEKSIHEDKPPLTARFLMARKKGLYQVIKAKLQRYFH